MWITAHGAFLARQGRAIWVCCGVVSVAMLGLADYLTGFHIAWSLFYLIPIFGAAWFAGRWPGILISVTSAAMWWVADVGAGHVYPHSLIGLWNALTRLGFFAVVTWLADSLRHALERQRALARIDFTTGALNPRAFAEVLESESERCRRHGRPFSLIYLDVDDFKTINDTHGHHAGDLLLRLIADTMRRQLRGNDLVARLGGDEFAALLPETSPSDATDVVRRLKDSLLQTTREHGSPVTLSMGVVACERDPGDVDDLIRCADDLMYEVKEHGKNGIAWARWRAPT